MTVGVVIVTFNTPSLIVPQLELLEKFCKDDFSILVVDNSSDLEAAKAIEYHSRNHHYWKINTHEKDSSRSHAMACNMAYEALRQRFDYLLFLDHDNYPIKPFSVVEMLQNKPIGGLGQQKSKTYFWPGFFMVKTSDFKELDFSVADGLDTGGMLWKSIEKVGAENCVFFGERHEQNSELQEGKSTYNFYSIIVDSFLHFVNGSNWAKSDNNEERINSLLNILKQRTS